jgi:pimeloyl-ACP methyl ester carboxylesterase
MYLEDAGAGPCVLALHGLGGGAHFFSGFARRLQPSYRVLSMDLPGTGRSAAEGPPSIDNWVDRLGRLIDEQGAAPVVLLGHSMGTIVALHAYAAWPDRIKALVFVGGLPRVRPPNRERLTARLAALEGVRDLAGWGSSVSPGVFSPATLAGQPELVALFERLFETQSLDAYVASTRVLLDADATHLIGSVRVPCLAVTGVDDQYAPPDAVAAFVQGLAPHARLEVIEACGHLPFLEQPEKFATVIDTFLRGLRA